MSSSSTDQPRKRQTVYKRMSRLCSTPVKKGTRRPLSISVSAVDTNSSSSTSKKRKVTIAQSPKRKQKKIRKKQKTRLGWKYRKKQAVLPTNIYSNWVTESEVSGDENANPQQTPTKRGTSGSEVLFQDLPSPELIREAYHVEHDRLQSPILQPRQKKAESPESINSDKNYEPYSPTDTSHLLLRINYPADEDKEDTEGEEDKEISLRKEYAVKTYSRPKQVRQPKKAVEPKDKSKQWLMDVAIPTTSSDMLWDDYVKDHPQEMCMYIAPPTNSTKRLTLNVNSEEEGNTNKQRKHYAKMNNDKKEPIKSLIWAGLAIPPNMGIIRATRNKSSKECVSHYDVYNFPESEDVEFERNSVTGARMSLNEFRHRRKVQKEKADEKAAKNNQNIVQILTNLKNQQTVQQKRRTLHQESQSEFKKRKIETISVLDRDLQRVNEIRTFASRLARKRRAMIANETLSDESTFSCSRFDFPMSLHQSTNDHGTNETKNNAKRRKVSIKTKPQITSIEALTALRYKRGKQHWNIVKK